ncbi:MAG: hypothetical protein Q7K21_09650 [Elusimicrobiota bacterium]|nr:hypothetical protein [Elusimicrobiota bacterium]
MSKKMFYVAAVFFVFLISGMLNSEKMAAYGYNSASGNISFETDNPANFYKEVQKIAVRYGVQTTNYNTYTDSRTKKQRVTATYKLSITSSAIFMSELSSLGNIKSQNYNDNPNYDYYSQSETKLSNLKKEKEKLSSSIKSVPLTIELIDREIQNLTNQVNSQKANLNVANISVTIGETGSFDYQGDMSQSQQSKKEEPKKINYFNITLVILLLLIIFLVTFNLFIVKKYLRK